MGTVDNLKIEYLFHSGVSVEVKKELFIFDYYKKGFDSSMLKEFEKVYVFVSHNHGDHFDRHIFDWQLLNSSIKYILSSDIGISANNNIFKMATDEELAIGNITVQTLDSTDEGVAYVVKTQSGTIFHAGDLNWWHWDGEPDEYNKGMADKFKGEINKIKEQSIDVAFIPVDKRLGESMYYSIDYLMENVDVRKVYPIHFWDDWEYIKQVKKDLAERPYYDRICFYGR